MRSPAVAASLVAGLARALRVGDQVAVRVALAALGRLGAVLVLAADLPALPRKVVARG